MFGWIKRKRTKDRKLAEAYELGRASAESMAADLDAFMQERFAPVFENFLGVLRKGILRSFHDEAVPPLTAARVEFDVFVENVEAMKSKMIQEISQALSGWTDLFSDVSTNSNIQKLIDVKVDTYCRELTLSGLKLLTDYADGLKDSDVEWRKHRPRLAARFPEVDT